MSDFDVPTAYTYLAITPAGYGGAYGKGNTVAEAKDMLKRYGGNLNRVVVYRLPAGALDAYVDDVGRIAWRWDEAADTTGTTELVYQRGLK